MNIALFCLLALFTLFSSTSGGVALVLGVAFALFFENPKSHLVKKYTPLLLQASVVGLGAAIHLQEVLVVGMQGAFSTLVSLTAILAVGMLLGKWLRLNQATTILLSMGTAICGGSAIAAVAPVIHAKDEEISVSLATVFMLNAAALFLFPPIGHYANFTETQFGLWSALAIHDTSSVVGASLQYGPEAFQIATTVKLARSLWIVPLTLLIAHYYKKQNATSAVSSTTSNNTSKKPWFILGFILVSALVTWVPILAPAGLVVSSAAKRLLVLTLFLIGSGLNKNTLKTVGMRPFAHGVILWVFAATFSFIAVQEKWINLLK